MYFKDFDKWNEVKKRYQNFSHFNFDRDDDVHKRIILLADRGLGILTTLKKVKPELNTNGGALRVAFTEILSGRSPESRGNGLKFVRKIVSENPISLPPHQKATAVKPWMNG